MAATPHYALSQAVTAANAAPPHALATWEDKGHGTCAVLTVAGTTVAMVTVGADDHDFVVRVRPMGWDDRTMMAPASGPHPWPIVAHELIPRHALATAYAAYAADVRVAMAPADADRVIILNLPPAPLARVVRPTRAELSARVAARRARRNS